MAKAKKVDSGQKEMTDRYCINCKKLKKKYDFYNSSSKISTMDGKINVCKKCIVKMIDEDDLNSVKAVLRQLDKPFIQSVWDASIESDRNTFGNYMRQMNSLTQYRDMTWADAIVESDDQKVALADDQSIDEEDGSFENPLDNFTLTSELRIKWGAKFKKEEIFQMETLWQAMMEGYIIETPSEQDYLKKCCITSILSNKAYENGDIRQGDQLITSYNSLMKAANFAPSTRNSSDKTGGVNSFSELFETIEKDGFIPMWPSLDNDTADMTLDHLKRWTRELVMGDPNLGTLVENQLNKMKKDDDEVKEEVDADENKYEI